MIWKRCPKDFFLRSIVLELTMNSANIAFNDRSTAVEKVMRIGGIEPNMFMPEELRKLTCNRIKKIRKQVL